MDVFGGLGIFGVEMFVKGDKVWVNEVFLRFYDIGMVILVFYFIGFLEFGFYFRVVFGFLILGEWVDGYRFFFMFILVVIYVIKVNVFGYLLCFRGLVKVFSVLNVIVRFFGKFEVYFGRRFGVVIVWDKDVGEVKRKVEMVVYLIELRMRLVNWYF